jgi:hypothetical protein
MDEPTSVITEDDLDPDKRPKFDKGLRGLPPGIVLEVIEYLRPAASCTFVFDREASYKSFNSPRLVCSAFNTGIVYIVRQPGFQVMGEKSILELPNQLRNVEGGEVANEEDIQ